MYYQAIGVTACSVQVGIVVAIGLYLVQIPVLGAFTALTPGTRELSEKFMLILCLGIVLRSIPMTAIVGVLRAGGDVKFCLGQDIVAQWCIGIPLAAFAALVFKVEPEWIYLLF